MCFKTSSDPRNIKWLFWGGLKYKQSHKNALAKILRQDGALQILYRLSFPFCISSKIFLLLLELSVSGKTLE